MVRFYKYTSMISFLLISSQCRTNRTLFKHVPTRHLKEEEITDISSPTASGEGGTGVIEAAFNTDDVEEPGDSTGVYTTAEQLSEKLLTMSLVPRARWQTLLNLDVIKVYLFQVYY
jgi:U3 small nucleolar RNA-associated protein 21